MELHTHGRSTYVNDTSDGTTRTSVGRHIKSIQVLEFHAQW